MAELRRATRRVAWPMTETNGRRRSYIVSPSDPSVRVPVSDVDLSDGTTFSIYDTSGPGSEPTVGLPALRAPWIDGRGDTIVDRGPGAADSATTGARVKPVTPWSGPAPTIRRAAPGKNVSQMHYARRGDVTPEMEFVALREGLDADVRARRGRTRPRHHPEQHQPSRVRADDHRSQLPREDQRQHRQLARWRRRSKKKSTR